MKVTLIQSNIVWGDAGANCLKASEAIGATPGSDLYILPEMFSTGFATEPEGLAESDCFSLGWMRDKARETGAAIYGSVATEEGGRYFNRFYFVTPDGAEVHYDKHHLFTFGGEHHRYTGGDSRVEVVWKGFRIRLAVCYDLRFPGWVRNTGDTPYDLLIYVASWPSVRRHAWDALLRARAIENQCYLAGVNRVGSEPSGLEYEGGTVLLDPWGKEIARCADHSEECATATIDLEPLQSFRKQFPVLKDAD